MHCDFVCHVAGGFSYDFSAKKRTYLQYCGKQFCSFCLTHSNLLTLFRTITSVLSIDSPAGLCTTHARQETRRDKEQWSTSV